MGRAVDGQRRTAAVQVNLFVGGGGDGGRILANWRAIAGGGSGTCLRGDKRQRGVEDWAGSLGFASADQTAVVATRANGSTFHWTTISTENAY